MCPEWTLIIVAASEGLEPPTPSLGRRQRRVQKKVFEPKCRFNSTAECPLITWFLPKLWAEMRVSGTIPQL